MPRFFFDVHDGKDIRDDEGIECADLQAARREAVRTSGEMLRDLSELWNGEIWQMTVRDGIGNTVSTLKFSGR